jgi:hypothetical protein
MMRSEERTLKLIVRHLNLHHSSKDKGGHRRKETNNRNKQTHKKQSRLKRNAKWLSLIRVGHIGVVSSSSTSLLTPQTDV